MNPRIAPVHYLESVNYFVDKELGKDNHNGRPDFDEVFPNLDKGMSDQEISAQLAEIVSHYVNIMNECGTLLYYLCFDAAIGFAPLKKGYAVDTYWAQGVYRAAYVDYRVYARLGEVVAENLRHSIYLPPLLKRFASEMLQDTFPVPKKSGPAITRDQLRNMCIVECMMLLNDELKMQIKSEAKEPRITASDLVSAAFSHVQIEVQGVAKPTPGTVVSVWKGDRGKARYEVKVLRWLEKKQKSNRWYNSARILYWINRIL